MKMTLVEMLDEVMIRSGPSNSVPSLRGALLEMCAVRPSLPMLIEVLKNEPSFVPVGLNSYGVDRIERADRLVKSWAPWP